MKKTYVFIAIGIILIAASLLNFTMDIDNRGHYFGNGVLCGIGLSVVVTQIIKRGKLRNSNHQ